MNMRTMVAGCGAVLGLALLLPAPAAWGQRPDPKAGDLEKRLDRLMQEMEELRRELRGGKGGPPAAEQTERARAEVKRQAADVEKLQTQLREATSRLQKAQEQLNNLEGRPGGRGGAGFGPGRPGFGPGGMGFGPGGPWGNWQERKDRPGERGPQPRGGDDLERRLERLLQDLQDLKRDLKR